jgi:uncharacterized protein YdcH (DUF465 family)
VPEHSLEVNPTVASGKPYQFHRLKGDMYKMDIATTDSLKEELMNRDPEFRELAREHNRYEQRLRELSALTYPNDEEQLEEITLKKKKLALKDQMYSIMLQYQKNQSLGH